MLAYAVLITIIAVLATLWIGKVTEKTNKKQVS